MQREYEPSPTCHNALLWWPSRTGRRVCMVCCSDPLQALEVLAGTPQHSAVPATGLSSMPEPGFRSLALHA
jgi:hypothetical protein